MKNSDKQFLDEIIEANNEKTDSYVKTKYLKLGSNRSKIETNLSNIVKYCDLKLDNNLIDLVLEKSKQYNAIGVFVAKTKVPHFDFSHFEFECEFNYKNYFVLPLLDVRREMLENIVILKFSLNKIELFNYVDGIFQSIELENIQESISKLNPENELTRDNSFPLKDQDDSMYSEEYIKTHLSPLIKMIETKVKAMKGKILIASDDSNIHVLTELIDDNLLLDSHLSGNFDDVKNNQLLELVIENINSNVNHYANKLKDELDVSESNQLQDQSFIDILSVINDGRISDMYIGNLDLNDMTEDTSISPLGANYIALEVLKYGGNIMYYPECEFDFSNNNILFKFRY